MLNIDLEGKVALVTGGSRGIGSGICKVLAKAGAFVVVNYASSPEKAKEVVAEIESEGGQAVDLKGDVTSMQDVKAMVDTIVEQKGRIDILVNNAGITSVNTLESLTEEEWDRIMQVNVDGVFNCTKQVVDVMLRQKSGVIINISSTGAFTGGGGGPHYSSSKAALHGFTRALARELAPKGIRVNSVAPTLIASDFLLERYPDPKQREKLVEQVPVGRIGEPEDVGYMVAFLASDLGSYINSEIIVMDGGRTFR